VKTIISEGHPNVTNFLMSLLGCENRIQSNKQRLQSLPQKTQEKLTLDVNGHDDDVDGEQEERRR